MRDRDRNRNRNRNRNRDRDDGGGLVVPVDCGQISPCNPTVVVFQRYRYYHEQMDLSGLPFFFDFLFFIIGSYVLNLTFVF